MHGRARALHLERILSSSHSTSKEPNRETSHPVVLRCCLQLPRCRGGNTFTVNEAPIPTVTTQNINQNDYTVRNVPNVFSGNVYPTAPCMGSSQVGGAGVGFGFSVGTSWKDDECGKRETARSFRGMGLDADELAILCTSEYAAVAPSCKAMAPPPAQ